MNILDALFTAGGGGIFGSILHLGTSWFEVYRKKKEAEVEIMLMNAKVEAAEKEAAWNAFTASQKQNDALGEIPPGVHPIVANIYALVGAFRSATRPALTWALLGILLCTFYSLDSYARAGMAEEINFGSFTALFWWFGSRYSPKARK